MSWISAALWSNAHHQQVRYRILPSKQPKLNAFRTWHAFTSESSCLVDLICSALSEQASAPSIIMCLTSLQLLLEEKSGAASESASKINAIDACAQSTSQSQHPRNNNFSALHLLLKPDASILSALVYAVAAEVDVPLVQVQFLLHRFFFLFYSTWSYLIATCKPRQTVLAAAVASSRAFDGGS